MTDKYVRLQWNKSGSWLQRRETMGMEMNDQLFSESYWELAENRVFMYFASRGWVQYKKKFSFARVQN